MKRVGIGAMSVCILLRLPEYLTGGTARAAYRVRVGPVKALLTRFK